MLKSISMHKRDNKDNEKSIFVTLCLTFKGLYIYSYKDHSLLLDLFSTLNLHIF